MNLPPYQQRIGGTCRKCGSAEVEKLDPLLLLPEVVKKSGKTNGRIRLLGPKDTFEPAFNPPWWKFWLKPHPERMRRDCSFCKAIYYELPKDVARVNAALKHADSLLENAMKRDE